MNVLIDDDNIPLPPPPQPPPSPRLIDKSSSSPTLTTPLSSSSSSSSPRSGSIPPPVPAHLLIRPAANSLVPPQAPTTPTAKTTSTSTSTSTTTTTPLSSTTAPSSSSSTSSLRSSSPTSSSSANSSASKPRPLPLRSGNYGTLKPTTTSSSSSTTSATTTATPPPAPVTTSSSSNSSPVATSSVPVTQPMSSGQHHRIKTREASLSMPVNSANGLMSALSLHHTHHQQTLHNKPNIIHDEDDEDEDENMVNNHGSNLQRLTSSSSDECKRYTVDKPNQYGIKQTRVLIVDMKDQALRFFKKDQCRTELPFNQLLKIYPKCQTAANKLLVAPTLASLSSAESLAEKKIILEFKEKRRAYELHFATPSEAHEFVMIMHKELEHTAAATRSNTISMAAGSPQQPKGQLNTRNNATNISSLGSGNFNAYHPTNHSTSAASSSTASALSSSASSSSTHTHSASSASTSAASSVHSDNDLDSINEHDHHDTAFVPGSPSSHSSFQHSGDQIETPSSPSSSSSSSSSTSSDSNSNPATYLDYAVTKRNKFGMKQSRIIVINSTNQSLFLLDDRRKFKKELTMKNIISVEIPKSKDKDGELSECFIIFKKESGQRPFQLFFSDPLERSHFCDQLHAISLSPISIKDESASVEDGNKHTHTQHKYI